MTTLTKEIAFELSKKKNGVITTEDLKDYDEFDDYCFTECAELLTEIEIPPTIKMLSKYCFHSCKKLSKVKLNQGLLEIGTSCFTRTSIESITIPEGVERIGSYAFDACVGLTNVSLPSTLRFIGCGAFFYCLRLNDVVIPEKINTINYVTFKSCTCLNNITIPHTVKTILPGVFDYSSLTVPRKKVYKDGGLLTYKAMNYDMTCRGFQYEAGKTYEIPADKEIELCRYGFHSCPSPFSCLSFYSGEYNGNIVICKCIAEQDIKESILDNKLASRKITILQKFDSFADAFNDYFEECAKIV